MRLFLIVLSLLVSSVASAEYPSWYTPPAPTPTPIDHNNCHTITVVDAYGNVRNIVTCN